MPKQRRLLIMISPKTTPAFGSRSSPPHRPAPPHDAASTTDSDSESSTMSALDLNEPSENLETILSGLREQLADLAGSTRSVRHQVKGLFARAKSETTEWWSEPLAPTSPELIKWLKKRGAPTEPTLDEFIEQVMAAATSLDLESRLMTFAKKDAAILFEGQTQITVYELLAKLPTFFE